MKTLHAQARYARKLATIYRDEIAIAAILAADLLAFAGGCWLVSSIAQPILLVTFG